ncbi:hypothetical protein Bca52824_089432 [Brassica carinata]|uniref:Reverse transcriptase zinc-binding domain-containing protein n=1 Tax=Brassica carinata TaxID=52824 RepID=A0A8X7PHT8_BRACI|nr:hypothetical protein Bca52824_089432 [Brassica carinata]
MTGTESIEHVLFKCDIAQEVWDIAGFPPIVQLANRSMVELMSLSIQRMGDDNLSLLQRRAIPWLLWTIWKNRNIILYADTQITLITQLQQANEVARLWHELNDAKQSIEVEGGLGNEHKIWEPPLSGFRKCNIHAVEESRSFIVVLLSSHGIIVAMYYIMPERPSRFLLID